MNTRKGWYTKHSFTNDFVNYLEDLYKKYGEDIFSIQGIANRHMDIVDYSREFFNKSGGNVADTSVDANANVKEKHIAQYNHENNKSLMKLNSLYLMYKYVKKYYDEKSAQIALDKVVSGEIFINDLNSLHQPYCYSFDLRSLLMFGMNFFKGNMTIKPPKRSDSFVDLVIQSTAFISNQLVGACSYPDFFAILNMFYEKEHGVKYINEVKTGRKLVKLFKGIDITVDNVDQIKKILSDQAPLSWAGKTWTTLKDERRSDVVILKLKNIIELWEKVKNQFQNVIYSFNWPFRGGQSLKYDEKLVILNNDETNKIQIGDFVESYIPDDVDNDYSLDISDTNQYTMSLNINTGKLENNKITSIIRHKLSDTTDMVNYETVTGSILSGTDNHALFSRVGEYIKEVVSDDEPTNVIVPFNFANDNIKQYVMTIEDKGARIHTEKEIALDKDWMFLIGEYIGDGSISGSRLSIHTYDKYMNDYLYETWTKKGFHCSIYKENVFNISLGINISNALISMFGKGSRNKHVPRHLAWAENIEYLIAGYIEADGHVRQDKGDCIISSVNRELVDDVQFILLSKGIISSIKYRENLTNSFVDKHCYYNLAIPAVYMRKILPFMKKKLCENKQRLNYQRQFFDFDGLYQLIMTKYNIKGLAEYGVVANRSRDKSLTYDDLVNIINWLTTKLKSNITIDEDFFKDTFGVKLQLRKNNLKI